MKTINQAQAISGNAQGYLFEEIINSSLVRFARSVQKMETNLVYAFTHLTLTKKVALAEAMSIQDIDPVESENVVLDLYLAEGMKLFSQGKYAANIRARKEGEEL